MTYLSSCSWLSHCMHLGHLTPLFDFGRHALGRAHISLHWLECCMCQELFCQRKTAKTHIILNWDDLCNADGLDGGKPGQLPFKLSWLGLSVVGAADSGYVAGGSWCVGRCLYVCNEVLIPSCKHGVPAPLSLSNPVPPYNTLFCCRTFLNSGVAVSEITVKPGKEHHLSVLQ